jgi:hypothetical protein
MSKDNSRPQISTSIQQVPGYVQEAQTNLLNAGRRLTDPHIGNAPANPVAPLTGDHHTAFAQLRDTAKDFYGMRPTMPGAGEYTVDGVDVGQLLNPYTDNVVDATAASMRHENDAALASIRARQAAAGAFGGSRGAVAERLQREGFERTLAPIIANLRHQGWTTAAGLADSNASRRLQAPAIENTILNDWMNRRRANAQSLLGIGDAQQAQEQAVTDVPYTMLERLRSVVPGSYGGTTTTMSPNNKPSTAQQLLGLGLTAAGLLL